MISLAASAQNVSILPCVGPIRYLMETADCFLIDSCCWLILFPV